MVCVVQIGSLGVKVMTFESRPYNICLRDRVWKLLPVYEGKDKDGKIVCEKEEALKRFKKNLNRVLTEIKGAEVVFSGDNNRYIELVNILSGLNFYDSNKHDELKDVIFYCCDILEGVGGDSFV